MADQKRFNGQVGFTNDVQIKIAGTGTEGPEQTFHGKNITDKIDPYQQGTTKLFPLGSKLKYGDREFVYAFMGGACTAGKLVAHKEHGKANHTNMAPTANTAAGSYTVSIETAGDTDLTANEYADGYIYIITDIITRPCCRYGISCSRTWRYSNTLPCCCNTSIASSPIIGCRSRS